MEWSSMEPMPAQPNADFFSDFIYDDTEYLDGIQNQGEPVRSIATLGSSGAKSFSVNLNTVQYGTLDGQDAALVVFHFHFNYPPSLRERITEARVEASFEETADGWFHPPSTRNIRNDPVIKKVWPGMWQVDSIQRESTVEWEINPQISILEVSAGLGSVASSHQRDKEGALRMVAGLHTSTRKHHSFNAASWNICEHGLRKGGVPRHLSGGVLITLPQAPAHPVACKVNVAIKTDSAALNILRPMRTRRDEPIYLDRKTPAPPTKACSFGLKGQGFEDSAFPWQDVYVFPQMDELKEVLDG